MQGKERSATALRASAPYFDSIALSRSVLSRPQSRLNHIDMAGHIRLAIEHHHTQKRLCRRKSRKAALAMSRSRRGTKALSLASPCCASIKRRVACAEKGTKQITLHMSSYSASHREISQAGCCQHCKLPTPMIDSAAALIDVGYPCDIGQKSPRQSPRCPRLACGH